MLPSRRDFLKGAGALFGSRLLPDVPFKQELVATTAPDIVAAAAVPKAVLSLAQSEHVLADFLDAWRINLKTGVITPYLYPAHSYHQYEIIQCYIKRFTTLYRYGEFLKQGGDPAAVLAEVTSDKREDQESFIKKNAGKFQDKDKRAHAEILSQLNGLDIPAEMRKLEADALLDLERAVPNYSNNIRRGFHLEAIQMHLDISMDREIFIRPEIRKSHIADNFDYKLEDLRFLSSFFTLMNYGMVPELELTPEYAEAMSKIEHSILGRYAKAYPFNSQKRSYFSPDIGKDENGTENVTIIYAQEFPMRWPDDWPVGSDGETDTSQRPDRITHETMNAYKNEKGFLDIWPHPLDKLIQFDIQNIPDLLEAFEAHKRYREPVFQRVLHSVADIDNLRLGNGFKVLESRQAWDAAEAKTKAEKEVTDGKVTSTTTLQISDDRLTDVAIEIKTREEVGTPVQPNNPATLKS